MPSAPITLTTDFGGTDPFVGIMKGVIAGIAPAAKVIDLSHGVKPFDTLDAAFTLAQSFRYFPRGTIHVVVVDPGVGSARRPILAEAAGQYFVGPDNGVFTLIYDAGPHKVRELTAAKYFQKAVSRTFHGRDIFAPVAAHLAKGVRPAQFGKLIHDAVQMSNWKPQRTGKRFWTGQILKVDHFGNLITNLHITEFEEIKTRPFDLLVGLQVTRRLALNYAECEPGEVFAIVGSSGYLEVSVNQGSAAQALGCGAGAPVELTLW